MPIDVVITWVDGDDSEHKAKRRRYSNADELVNDDVGGDIRFTSIGEINYCVASILRFAPFVRKIEIEVENLDMLKEALEAGADIIMLDNMSVEDMKEAVRLTAGKAETECSGNVTRENVARLVDIGVDYISSGALTHSSPILDLSLKNLHAI